MGVDDLFGRAFKEGKPMPAQDVTWQFSGKLKSRGGAKINGYQLSVWCQWHIIQNGQSVLQALEITNVTLTDAGGVFTGSLHTPAWDDSTLIYFLAMRPSQAPPDPNWGIFNCGIVTGPSGGANPQTVVLSDTTLFSKNNILL